MPPSLPPHSGPLETEKSRDAAVWGFLLQQGLVSDVFVRGSQGYLACTVKGAQVHRLAEKIT